jgi:transcriptional repressor NrdR
MRCPFCKVDDDRVVDSRASNDGFAIRRRRECVACDRRYTTYERIEESPLRVVKKDQRREPFERRKILLGLLKACEKRPIPIAQLEAITERIENKVLEEFDTEVPVTLIGKLVMDELKRIDQVAYVRFASVYREFKDIHEFLDELKAMLAAEGAEHRDAGRRDSARKDGGKREPPAKSAARGAAPKTGARAEPGPRRGPRGGEPRRS